MFVKILLPIPLKETFTYNVPQEFLSQVKCGMRVEVPFGKTIYAGLVKEICNESDSGNRNVDDQNTISNLKSIISVIDNEAKVNSKQFEFWKWMSEYYMCSEGDIMAAAMPVNAKKITPFITKQKSTKKQKSVAANATANAATNTATTQDVATEKSAEALSLTPAQHQACEKIRQSFSTKNVTLLHGVTSSGKTEIYTKLIQDTLEQGKEVLYLLPEIALTTQMIMRLKKYFGEEVGIYHSRNTEKEKIDVWNNAGKKYKIILGARSAIFLPFTNLGLVIIDEEHETSFKQQDPAPRYHARDSAIYLASTYKAKTILGSATPSIETYNNALNGKYGLVELFTRYGDFKMPQMWVSNLRKETTNKTMNGCFSSFLTERIGQALQEKKQVILFQNRRGFSARLECESCGFSPVCKNCDVTQTYHKKNSTLQCHYCGYTSYPPSICPSCNQTGTMRMKGFGTERVEEDLAVIFPDAKVARMDLDSTRTKNAFQNLITDFQNRKIDILVGTQMVTKGLDFDNVAVVGILNADGLITFPDFRSHERSFHLMTQVSGRAGRKGGKSDVVIQSYKPEYEVIRQVMNNDYAAMYTTQIDERVGFRYPPFYRLINITVKHTDQEKTNKAAHELAALLKPAFGGRLLGPEYPLISKINAYYLMSMMLKFERGTDLAEIKRTLAALLEKFYRESPHKAVRIVVDVDPY